LLAKTINPYQGLKLVAALLFMLPEPMQLAKTINPYQGLKLGANFQVGSRNAACKNH